MLLLKDCSFKHYHIYFSHFKGYYIHHYLYNIYQHFAKVKKKKNLYDVKSWLLQQKKEKI